MSLISLHNNLPNSFFVSVLNSNLIFDYYREFINCTVNIQINDLRQIPIIIPTEKQLHEILELFENIYELKRNDISKSTQIAELEKLLDVCISNLYAI